MSLLNIKDQQLKRALRKAGKELVSDELNLDFKEGIEELGTRMRSKIEYTVGVQPDRKITLISEARITIKNWIQEQMNNKRYADYVELMREQGKTPPHTRRDFFSSRTSKVSLNDKFKCLEEIGIKVGSWVRMKNRPDTVPKKVVAISLFCNLVFRRDNGKPKVCHAPMAYEVVEEGDQFKDLD